MPCRFASSGTVATSRSASRAILALNVASNFLRDLVISVLHRLRQSRTLHTLTFGPISGVHFTHVCLCSGIISCTTVLHSLQSARNEAGRGQRIERVPEEETNWLPTSRKRSLQYEAPAVLAQISKICIH